MSYSKKNYSRFENFNFGDFNQCVEIQKRAEIPNNNTSGSQVIGFKKIAVVNVFWQDLKPIEAVGEGSEGGQLTAKNIKNAFIVMPYRKDITSSDTWILSKATGTRYEVDSLDDTDKKRRYLKVFVVEKGSDNIVGAEL